METECGWNHGDECDPCKEVSNHSPIISDGSRSENGGHNHVSNGGESVVDHHEDGTKNKIMILDFQPKTRQCKWFFKKYFQLFVIASFNSTC